jgi:hypothetical protein
MYASLFFVASNQYIDQPSSQMEGEASWSKTTRAKYQSVHKKYSSLKQPSDSKRAILQTSDKITELQFINNR